MVGGPPPRPPPHGGGKPFLPTLMTTMEGASPPLLGLGAEDPLDWTLTCPGPPETPALEPLWGQPGGPLPRPPPDESGEPFLPTLLITMEGAPPTPLGLGAENPLGRTLTCPVPPETPAPDPLWDPIDPLPLLESQMATHPIHWHATTPYHFTTPLFQCQVHILQHHLPCARTPPFLRHHLPCVRPTFADTIPSVSRPPSLCYKTPFTGSGTPSLCHCIPK